MQKETVHWGAYQNREKSPGILRNSVITHDRINTYGSKSIRRLNMIVLIINRIEEIRLGAIDWTKIHWRNFEKFMFYALQREGFCNTLWFGIGGGDDARDITATTTEILPLNLSYKRKWIFQCKKWANLPQKSLIREEAEVASEHNPDFWVLIVPFPIQAGYNEKLDHVESKMDFAIKVIAIHEIEMLIEKHKDLLPVLLKGDVLSDEVVKSIDAAEDVQDVQEVLRLKQEYKSDAKKEE